jgi:hypothetical protein
MLALLMLQNTVSMLVLLYGCWQQLFMCAPWGCAGLLERAGQSAPLQEHHTHHISVSHNHSSRQTSVLRQHRVQHYPFSAEH